MIESSLCSREPKSTSGPLRVCGAGLHPGADLQRQRCAGEAASQADHGGGRHGAHGDPPADGLREAHLHHPGILTPVAGSLFGVCGSVVGVLIEVKWVTGILKILFDCVILVSSYSQF